jgi:hypothetical protein
MLQPVPHNQYVPMNQPLHLIYIPGLGDRRLSSQRYAVSTWSRWGVEAELFEIKWYEGEWPPKLKKLLARIDELSDQGKTVALVGASAGASAVINAYAERRTKIVGCILIAGKANRPETIGMRYISANPAFKASADQAKSSLARLTAEDRRHIQSRYALIDETVYRADSRIDGAVNKLVLSIGHVITIGSQLTLGAPSFIAFLKKQARG